MTTLWQDSDEFVTGLKRSVNMVLSSLQAHLIGKIHRKLYIIVDNDGKIFL